jgi:chromosome partitioning protein
MMRTGREFALRTALEDVRGEYDWILLDCAPTLGVLTLNALAAASRVLVPLQCETLSYRGVGQLLDTVADVRRLANRSLRVLGVLPTLYDARTAHARAVLADVADRFGVPVLEPPIPRSIRFAEAPATGRSVLATAGTSRGAMAYRELALRLLKGEGDPGDGTGDEPADPVP